MSPTYANKLAEKWLYKLLESKHKIQNFGKGDGAGAQCID